MVKAVIVDLDGTLIDSIEAHALSWQEALRTLGKRVSLEEIIPLFGKGPWEITATIIGEGATPELIKEITARRKKIFWERYRTKVKAFPGARELLCFLKGKGSRIIVASCGHQEDVEYFLQSLNLKPCLDEYVSADDVDRCKPRPDIFDLALRRAEATPQQAVAVGDSIYDVLAARALRIPTIALLSSGAEEKALRAAGASEVYADISELLREYHHSLLATT